MQYNSFANRRRNSYFASLIMQVTQKYFSKFAAVALAQLCFFSCAQVFAQSLNIGLVVAANVPAEISTWNAHHDVIKAIITNSGDEVDARFEADITRNGVKQAETGFTQMPIVKIPKGVSTFYADQIIPFAALSFYDEIDPAIGKLQPGTYELAIRLCSGGIEMGICMFTTQQFVVADTNQPPQLLFPKNNDAVDSGVPIIFNWKPLSGAASGPVHYHFAISLLHPGSTPDRAMRHNHPVFEITDTATQFVLMPDAGVVLKPGSSYVWMVEPVSGPDQSPLLEGKFRSDPFVFSMKP